MGRAILLIVEALIVIGGIALTVWLVGKGWASAQRYRDERRRIRKQ